jgi:hypothetical protein
MSSSQTMSTAPPTAGGQRTAENRRAEVDGETFVYRRFGNDGTDAPPLLCLQHFLGNLDNWDPALVDRLAEDREVILLDNRGVGSSTGTVPDNIPAMARDALHFVDAPWPPRDRPARLLARRLRRPRACARRPTARPQAHPRRHRAPGRAKAPPHV